MKKILIIDDDRLICNSIASVARTLGYDANMALNIKEGLQTIQSDSYDLVFLDVRMPDGNGIEIIPQISRNSGSPEVIIITGYGDPESVEAALSKGAWDYIEKPFSKDDLVQMLKDALIYQESNKQPGTFVDFEKEGIIGQSHQMKRCLSLLAKTLTSETNVLITGETGTGKELFARAIHNNSKRAGNEFVVVDCAAMPPNLAESILFGHEKGSYTGADKSQQGLVQQAHKGTLFLDEVGELPLSLQKKFLRVLQEGRFRPVGKPTEVESDFRIISATNRDLEKMVEDKRFRKDLLFRLQSIIINLPSLRERPEDILELTEHYLKNFNKKYGLKPKRLTPAFRDIILSYSWPGNVRELIHALERALTVAQDTPVLVPKHLPPNIHMQVKLDTVVDRIQRPAHTLSGESLPELKEVREEAINKVEQHYLQELMSYTKGNIEMSCKISGLSRSRLYALLKKFNIS